MDHQGFGPRGSPYNQYGGTGPGFPRAPGPRPAGPGFMLGPGGAGKMMSSYQSPMSQPLESKPLFTGSSGFDSGNGNPRLPLLPTPNPSFQGSVNQESTSFVRERMPKKSILKQQGQGFAGQRSDTGFMSDQPDERMLPGLGLDEPGFPRSGLLSQSNLSSQNSMSSGLNTEEIPGLSTPMMPQRRPDQDQAAGFNPLRTATQLHQEGIIPQSMMNTINNFFSGSSGNPVYSQDAEPLHSKQQMAGDLLNESRENITPPGNAGPYWTAIPKKGEIPEIRCEICDLTFQTKYSYHNHTVSITHTLKKEELKKKEKVEGPKTCRLCEKTVPANLWLLHLKMEAHLRKLSQAFNTVGLEQLKDKHPYLLIEGKLFDEFYCMVCGVHNISGYDYQRHVTGKSHLWTVEHLKNKHGEQLFMKLYGKHDEPKSCNIGEEPKPDVSSPALENSGLGTSIQREGVFSTGVPSRAWPDLQNPIGDEASHGDAPNASRYGNLSDSSHGNRPQASGFGDYDSSDVPKYISPYQQDDEPLYPEDSDPDSHMDKLNPAKTKKLPEWLVQTIAVMEEKKNKRMKELQEVKRKEKEEMAKREAERKMWDDVVNELVEEKLYQKDEYDPGGKREPEPRHQEPDNEPVYTGYDGGQRMGSPMVSVQVQDRRPPPSVEHVYQTDPYSNRPLPGGSHSRDTSIDRSRDTSLDRMTLEQNQYPLGYGPSSNPLPLPDPIRDYEAYNLHLKPGHVPDGRHRKRKPTHSYNKGRNHNPHPQSQLLQQQGGYQFTPPPSDRSRSHHRTDRGVSSDHSSKWDRSPSPGRRWRSPSPIHRGRSPSSTRRRRSHSPAHRRRSPSPVRRRRSPSPARRRRSPSPARRPHRSPSPGQRRRDFDISDRRTQSPNVTRQRSPVERSRNTRDKHQGPKQSTSTAVQNKNVPAKGSKPANKTPAKAEKRDTQERGAKRAHSPVNKQNKDDPSKHKSLQNQSTRTPSSEKKPTQDGEKQNYDKSILERLQKNGKKLTCKICKTTHAFINGFESHVRGNQHSKISQRLKGLLLGGQVRKEFGDMDVPNGYDKEIKLTSAFEKALAQATAAWKSGEGKSTSKVKQEDTNKVTSQHGSKKPKLELSATRQEQNSSVEKSHISPKSEAASNTDPKKIGKGQTEIYGEFDAYLYADSGDDVGKKQKDVKQKIPPSAQKKETLVEKKNTVVDKKNEAVDTKDKGERGKQGKKNYYTIPVLTGQRDRTKGVTLKIIQTEEPKAVDSKDDPRQYFNIPVVEGKGGRGKGKRSEERQMTEVPQVPEESKLCELEDTPPLSDVQQELIRKQIRLVLAEELGGKTPELMEKIMATVSSQGGVNLPSAQAKTAATENQKQKDEKDAKVSDSQQGQAEKASSTGVVNKQKKDNDSKSAPVENKDTSDEKPGDKISDKNTTESVKNEKNQIQQEKQGKDSSNSSGEKNQMGDDKTKIPTSKEGNEAKDDTNASAGKADQKKGTGKSQGGEETKNSPVKPVNKPILKDKEDGDFKTAAGKASQSDQTEKKEAEENKSTALEKPNVFSQQKRNGAVPVSAAVSNQNAPNRNPITPLFQRPEIKNLFPNPPALTSMRVGMRQSAPQVTNVQRFPQMMQAQSRPPFPHGGFQNRTVLPQRPPGPVTSQNMNTPQNVISNITVKIQNQDNGPRPVMRMSGPRPIGNSQPFPNNQMGMSGPRPSGNSQPFPINQLGMSGPRPRGMSNTFPNNQMGMSGPRPSGNLQPFQSNQMGMSGPRPSGNSQTYLNNQMGMSGPRPRGISNTFPNNQMGMSGPRPSGNSQPFPNNQMGMSGPRPSLSSNPVLNNQTTSPGQNPNLMQRTNIMQKTAGKFRKFPPATSQYKFIAKRIRRGGKFLLSNRNTDYKKALLERANKMGMAADRRPNKQSNIDKNRFHGPFRGAGQKAGMSRQTRGNVGHNLNEQNFGHGSETSNMELEPTRARDDRRFERETEENMGNRGFLEKQIRERENIQQDHRESAWRRDQDQGLPDERKFHGEETGRPFGREERFPKGLGSDRRTESDARGGEQSDVYRQKAHQARLEIERFERRNIHQMEQERLHNRRELDHKRQQFGKRIRDEGNWQEDVRPEDQEDIHGHKRKRLEGRFEDHDRRRSYVEGYSQQESWKFEEDRRLGFHDEERHTELRPERRQARPGRERETHANRRELQDDTNYIDHQHHKRESSHREEWHRNREQIHEDQGHDELENRHELEKRHLYREQQRHREERFDHRDRRPEQPDRHFEMERRHFEEHFHDEGERSKREMAFHDDKFHERDAHQRGERFSHPRDERPHQDDRSNLKPRSGRKAHRDFGQEHQHEFPKEQRPGSLERRRHQHSHEHGEHTEPVEGRHSEQRTHLREIERQRQAVEQEYHHKFPEEQRRGSVERRRRQHSREGRGHNDNVEDRHSERARRDMERRHQDFGQEHHPEFPEQQRQGSHERRRHQHSREGTGHNDNVEDRHSDRAHRRNMERQYQDFGQEHHPEYPEQQRRGSVERRRHQRSQEDWAHTDIVEDRHSERAYHRDLERHHQDSGQDHHTEFPEQEKRISVERRRHQRNHEDRAHADTAEGRRVGHRAHGQDMERQHQDIGQQYHLEFPEEQRKGSVERRGYQHNRDNRVHKDFVEGRHSEERVHRREMERQRQEYHSEFPEEQRPGSLERRRSQHRHEGRAYTDIDENRHEQRVHRRDMERRHQDIAQKERDHRGGRLVEDRNYQQQEHHREVERVHQDTSQQDDDRRRGRSSSYRRDKEQREQRMEENQTLHNFEQTATEDDFVNHLREITGITDESVLVQAVRAVQSLEPDVIATLATMDPIIMQGIISGAASIESVLAQLPQSVVVALEEGNLHPEVLQRMMGGGFVDVNLQDGELGSNMNMNEERFRERNREGRRRGYRIRR